MSQTIRPDAAMDPPLDSNTSVDEDMKHLKMLLETSDLRTVRAFVSKLAEKWPDSERVQHKAKVLAPPIVRSVPRTGRSFNKERAWLTAHAREYPGCWIALKEDELVAADPDYHVVRKATLSKPEWQDALLHFQPAPHPPAEI